MRNKLDLKHHPSCDSTASDISGYSLRPRTWRIQKAVDQTQPKLRVNILRTEDVVAKKDHNPSLFCIMSVGNTVVQTRTVADTLNPSWGPSESFTFTVLPSDKYLALDLWDQRPSTAKPVFMGHSILSLSSLSSSVPSIKKLYLGRRSHKSHVSGKVVIEVAGGGGSWLDPGLVPASCEIVSFC